MLKIEVEMPELDQTTESFNVHDEDSSLGAYPQKRQTVLALGLPADRIPFTV
jgi:hypothetical protein